MSILRQSRRLIQDRFLPHVTPKHKELFQFGIKAFSLRPFVSLNSNARTIIQNRNTAESKVYRLVTKEGFAASFLKIIKAIGIITKDSWVVGDFSSFCGFETLAFGWQTRLGRAIPIYANAITYPIREETSQNLFIIEQIKILVKALGLCPKLVFDRGFAIPSLIAFLVSKGAIFYIRIKEGKSYQIEKNDPVKRLVRNAKTKDFTCLVYDTALRIVVSDNPKNGNPPWYILTSDFTSSREEVLQTYYYRFEIEETFKDLKHVYDLKNLQIKTIQTFTTILWFLTLGFWIIELLGLTTSYANRKLQVHKKKALSFVRQFLEAIQLEFSLSWEILPSARSP